MLTLWCAPIIFLHLLHAGLCLMHMCIPLHAPRVVRQHGQTALMLAAFNGRTDTVRLLLEHGADADFVKRVSAAFVGPADGGCKGSNFIELQTKVFFCPIHFFTCCMPACV